MGFLKQLRARTKLGDNNASGNARQLSSHSKDGAYNPSYTQAYSGRDCIARLPPELLKQIVAHVCPHTNDLSFDLSERADVGDGCMLCDLRDLSNCARVRRAWYRPVQEQLYQSVRIDPVHYCALEEIYDERRRRKSKSKDAEDVPATRLRLLANTLKSRQWLGNQVRFLKLPYMTRETRKADLARAVSACTNLQYVDLPTGFYTGDPSCAVIRQELQSHCPDLRAMKYYDGSEQLFQLLLQRHWQNIELLELKNLRVDPTSFRMVVASLSALRELKVTEVPCFTDEIFNISPQVPGFPPLQSLSIEDCQGITAVGLARYLERHETREVLKTLSLINTGVQLTRLFTILLSAPRLRALTIIASVSQSLPLEPLPPIASSSLQTLHYEITPAENNTSSSLIHPSDSYYTYLVNSLLSNSLPSLRALYVRDPSLPDALLLAPPQSPFATGGSNSGGSNRVPPPRGLAQPLEVYTKGLDEAEWIFNAVTPSAVPGRPGSAYGGRPLSAYSASRGLGPQWGGDARKSVVVGNGFGGFLAVPADDGIGAVRPGSSGSWRTDEPKSPTGSVTRRSFWGAKREGSPPDKRVSRADLWR